VCVCVCKRESISLLKYDFLKLPAPEVCNVTLMWFDTHTHTHRRGNHHPKWTIAALLKPCSIQADRKHDLQAVFSFKLEVFVCVCVCGRNDAVVSAEY